MRIWTKILIGTLVVVLVLVGGAALFISQMDPNDYRGTLADVVEKYTGRRLQVSGDLRIKLLPVPSVEANDVTFANAPWASRPDMVRAKHVRAEVALFPLLKGQVLVQQFVVLEPKVFLETDTQGRGNWQFADKDKPVGELGRDTSARPDGVNIRLTSVRIENAGFDYLDGTTSRRTVVNLSELTLGSTGTGDRERVALDVQGSFQDLPLGLHGMFGAPGAIVRNQPIEVDLEGAVGDARFTLTGDVGKPLQGADMHLELTLDSASTKRITDAVGIELEELGPVGMSVRVRDEQGYLHLDPLSARARLRGIDANIHGSITHFPFDPAVAAVEGAGKGHPMKVDLQGSFGEAAFEIAGQVDKPLEVEDANLAVAFETPTTAPLVQLAGLEFEEIGPMNLTLTVRAQSGHFDFDDIRMTARPGGTDASLSGSFKNLILDSEKAKGEPAKVDVEGVIGEARFVVSGDIGKPLEARDLRMKVALDAKTTRPLTDLAGVDFEEIGPLTLRFTVNEKDGRFDVEGIDATARPRNAEVVVKGSVRDAVASPKPDLDVKLSAKSLRQLDGRLSDSGPVSVSARVRPSGNVIEVRDLAAKVGKSNLAGSATIDIGGERPKASVKLRGSLIDLAELAPARERAETEDAARKSPGGKVFPDTPFPLDVLAKANGDIEIAVDRLITRKLTLEKVNVAAKLDNGTLNVKPAANVAGGKIGGTIDIDSRVRPAKFTAKVDASKVGIGALTKEMRGYETGKGLLSDLDVNLSGKGESVRALMAGLDGDVRLVIGEGSFDNNVLDRVGADLLTQIVGVAVPTDEKDKVTTLRCGVMRFAIENGDAVADETLVLETNKVLLKGSGLIDLKTEELELGAKLAARQGIRIGTGTLSSLVQVKGTLAEPRLATDLSGMVKTGARVGIAFATAGLSLLAETAYGYVSEDPQPCQTALERTIKADPGLLRALFAPKQAEGASKETEGAEKKN